MNKILEKYKAGELGRAEFLAAGYKLELGDRCEYVSITKPYAYYCVTPNNIKYANEYLPDDNYVVTKSAQLDRLLAKPVFTQAMKDAGQLPPVGSEVRIAEDEVLLDTDTKELIPVNAGAVLRVIGHAMNNASEGGLVTLTDEHVSGFLTITPSYVKPLKSPEEMLVDELVHTVEGLTVNHAKLLVNKYNITSKE